MKDEKKSIIIIGAGLAGLSAGCYAQMNGYDTTVFEAHYMAGGYATKWTRKGYIFDGAMDWLNGINPKEKDSIMWRELGFLNNRKIAYFEDVVKVKDRNGDIWTFWCDPDKLERELMVLTDYKEDRKLLKRLCSDIKQLIKAPTIEFTLPETLMSTWDTLKMAYKFLPIMRILIKYKNQLSRDFAARFKDPRLREIMSYSYFDPAMPQSIFTMVYQMVAMHKKTLGFTEGGGHGVAEYLAEHFSRMGGNIRYRSCVDRVIVKDDKAIGVKLKNGTEHFADYVISAGDTRSAVYNLLEGKYINEDVNRIYNEGKAYPSLLRVYFGVDMDFSSEPHSMVYLLNKNLDIPGLYENHIKNSLIIRHYCSLDKNFAPPGKSIVNSVFFADYDYWKNLRLADRKEYYAQKDRIKDLVLDEIEKIYPGFKDKIEHAEVATPVTYEKYTKNYRGSIKGWVDDGTDITDWIKKVGMNLPGLSNFYMIGQWVVHGGMIRVVASGRHVIQTLCKQDRKKFNTKPVIEFEAGTPSVSALEVAMNEVELKEKVKVEA